MESRHARYPFLSAAREAVGEAGVDLADLVASDDPAVDRGRERVERALVEGTVDAGPDTRAAARTELLSYPVARVLVSLLDTPGAVEKYAAAEADTAHERFTDEFDGQATLSGDRVTLTEFLREFDLAGDVRERPADTVGSDADERGGPEYAVAVGTYLRYAPAGDDWKLVRRELADGWVRVSRAEVADLLREAVERRVASGLPFEVPDAIADPLADSVRDLRSTLASVEYPRTIETVAPEHFPPCIAALVRRARADEDLDATERFALVSFLAYLDMSAEDVRDFCGRHGEAFAYTTERLAGEGGAYPPPSFVTLRAQGVCDCDDGDHDGTAHPLAYYAARLAGEDENGERDNAEPAESTGATGATDGAE